MKDKTLSVIERMLDGEYNENFGICKTLDSLAFDNEGGGYELVGCLSSDWEHYSGDEAYPVSGYDIFHKSYREVTLWKGEQLELRMSLLKHLKSSIEKLSDEEFIEIINEGEMM